MKLKISFFLLIIFIFMIVISGCVRVKCGDGVCHVREERRSSCPQDCEEQIVQPPIKPPEQPSVTSPSTIKPGDYKEPITVDNRERTYILHVPTGYTEEKEYPLVLVFHGGLGTAEKIADQTGFSDIADKESFIAVYPEGIGRSWNDGRGTTNAEKQGVDDVKFTKELIKHLEAKLSIDSNRIYATGASNGGMMTYRLTCDAPELFAAVAPVIGNIPEPRKDICKPSVPIPLLTINGIEDPLMPLLGGDCCGQGPLGQGGRVISTEDSIKIFLNANGCSQTSKSEFLSIIVNDGTRVEKRTYSCSQEPVISYLIHGGGHAWPPNQAALESSGVSSQNIDTTEVVWEFFESHSK